MSKRKSKAYARAAVDWVRCQYPPGTMLRHKASGKLYMIGVKFSMSYYWMMPYDGTRKGVLPAYQIKNEFIQVES